TRIICVRTYILLPATSFHTSEIDNRRPGYFRRRRLPWAHFNDEVAGAPPLKRMVRPDSPDRDVRCGSGRVEPDWYARGRHVLLGLANGIGPEVKNGRREHR